MEDRRLTRPARMVVWVLAMLPSLYLMLLSLGLVYARLMQ
jgi:hypothetical protein